MITPSVNLKSISVNFPLKEHSVFITDYNSVYMRIKIPTHIIALSKIMQYVTNLRFTRYFIEKKSSEDLGIIKRKVCLYIFTLLHIHIITELGKREIK